MEKRRDEQERKKEKEAFSAQEHSLLAVSKVERRP